MSQRVNYGSWWRYSWQRLGGLDLGGTPGFDTARRRSGLGDVVLTSFSDRRDRAQFAAAHGDPGVRDHHWTSRPPAPICIAPITYTGGEDIKADIASEDFKASHASPERHRGRFHERGRTG